VVSNDILRQIEKLAELKEKEILTEAEFQQKKTALLNEMNSFVSENSNSGGKLENEGSYWLPVPSMILGIIAILACFDDSAWDSDTITGLAVFAIAGLVLGIVSVSNQEKGKGMAITGITLSSIAILVLIGLTTT
jgi:hypothetical protein